MGIVANAAALLRLTGLLGVMLVPVTAWAQSATTGGIAGEVKDTTGAVLPGVTVEASSPALIEKARVVVTDEQGRYQIVELRPGRYAVSFSLTGFGTVKRDGLDLNTGVTLPVNAELKVGALEETVTVSGASPVVDVQNVRTQNVMSREQLDALPTGKSIPGYAALTLGATSSAFDVGGAKGESTIGFVVHGSRHNDQRLAWDGMLYNAAIGTTGGSNRIYMVNQNSAQEIVLEVGGMSAETESGGIQLNVVPKDGGNIFSGTFLTGYTGRKLQSTNLTDELRASGLVEAPQVKKIYDVGGGLGGPIQKDRLWFYTAHRWWSSEEYAAGSYFNKTQHTPFYTPDFSRRGYASRPNTDYSGRLTWHATAKQKITFFQSVQNSCNCYMTLEANRAPEASNHVRYWPVTLTQGTWSYPVTSRLLLQAGATYGHNYYDSERIEGVTEADIPITELSSGFLYNSRVGLSGSSYGYTIGNQTNERVSVSYITGSHAFKAGVFYYLGMSEALGSGPALEYSFRNQVPVQVTYYAAPLFYRLRSHNVGIYAQDQWTLRRLTLNLGVRLDSISAHSPAQGRPAGQFVPELQFEKIDNLINWKDVGPRLGVSYDLFGNGKTAIKGSLGRYVAAEQSALPVRVMPTSSIVQSATRTWNDTNSDYVPQDSELGGLSNELFGTVNRNTRYAADVTTGWGNRPYEWQSSAVLQHELRPGVGLLVGYFHTWYGNISANQVVTALNNVPNPGGVTDNLAVTPADYDPFCITVPRDPRLPGGGGNQLCGFYDIKPSAFGKVDNLVTQGSHYGKPTEVFDGLDVSVNARLKNGGLLAAGVSRGRVVVDNCFVVDSPQQVFCKQTNPPQIGGQAAGQTQVKLQAIYPLPGRLQASAVFQSLGGLPILANYTATNAEIAPSLGRNLGQCGTRPVCVGTLTVPLIEPGTQFEDRLNELDLSLKRTFQLGRGVRFLGSVDVYNVFNAANIRGEVAGYGSTWRRPTTVMLGRLVKLGAQFDF